MTKKREHDRKLLTELRAKRRRRRRRKGRLKARLAKIRTALKRVGARIKRVRARLRQRGKLRQPGADVSMYQGSIDWGGYTATWAFVKATEGVSWVDPTFSGARVAAMRKAGVVVGFYHFAHATEDPRAQARHFAATIKAAGAHHGDLAALDYEQPGGDVNAFVPAFVDELRKQTKGLSIGIYGGPYIATLRDDHGCWLWRAAYTSTPNPFPLAAWDNGNRWTFWQFTDHYSFGGIPSPCDASRFNGDAAAFQRLRS